MIKEYINKSPQIKIVLAILWGIGVGLIFRAACYGRKCVIVSAPKEADVTSKVYNENGVCYRLVSTSTTCTDKSIDEN